MPRTPQERQQEFEQKWKMSPSLATLRLFDHARDEAVSFQHNYIGTEHLLLGSILTPESRAPLVRLGLSLPKVRSAVEFIIGKGERPVFGETIGFTPRSNKAIELGVDEARRLNDIDFQPDHVILGILREGVIY